MSRFRCDVPCLVTARWYHMPPCLLSADDPDITGFDVRELQPGTKAIVLGFQTLQFIVLVRGMGS